MTPQAHFDAAQSYLERAEDAGRSSNWALETSCLSYAQVHATLALFKPTKPRVVKAKAA